MLIICLIRRLHGVGSTESTKRALLKSLIQENISIDRKSAEVEEKCSWLSWVVEEIHVMLRP